MHMLIIGRISDVFCILDLRARRSFPLGRDLRMPRILMRGGEDGAFYKINIKRKRMNKQEE